MMSRDDVEAELARLDMPESMKDALRLRYERLGRLEHYLLPVSALDKLRKLMAENEEQLLLCVEEVHEEERASMEELGDFTHYAVFSPLGLFTHFWDKRTEEWMAF